MDANGAAHGSWCNARAWPTRCRYCGNDVFFFTCDHGCKVFFNELGPPWPLHACTEYLATVVGRAQLERFMRQNGRYDPHDPATSLALDTVYGARIRDHATRPPAFQTVRVEPADNATVSGLGVIRYMHACQDVAAWLGAADCGPMGHALLGELARGEWWQVTLVTGDLAVADLKSYTGLVARARVDKLQCKDLVYFCARAFALPSLRPVWVFRELSAIMA